MSSNEFETSPESMEPTIGSITPTSTDSVESDIIPGSVEVITSIERGEKLKRGVAPVLVIPPDIHLHSPSEIIGTPFAVDAGSDPFEYPFPPSSSTSSSTPSPSASSARLSSPPPSANYSPMHPKLKPPTPVVPPTLRAKQKRLLERISAESSGSETSEDVNVSS